MQERVEEQVVGNPLERDALAAAAFVRDASRVKDKFRSLGHGSQTEASHDLRISPAVLSIVLAGKYIDQTVLGRLETWADGKTAVAVLS